jgi:hypothetical protein
VKKGPLSGSILPARLRRREPRVGHLPGGGFDGGAVRRNRSGLDRPNGADERSGKSPSADGKVSMARLRLPPEKRARPDMPAG